MEWAQSPPAPPPASILSRCVRLQPRGAAAAVAAKPMPVGAEGREAPHAAASELDDGVTLATLLTADETSRRPAERAKISNRAHGSAPTLPI